MGKPESGDAAAVEAGGDRVERFCGEVLAREAEAVTIGRREFQAAIAGEAALAAAMTALAASGAPLVGPALFFYLGIVLFRVSRPLALRRRDLSGWGWLRTVGDVVELAAVAAHVTLVTFLKGCGLAVACLLVGYSVSQVSETLSSMFFLFGVLGIFGSPAYALFQLPGRLAARRAGELPPAAAELIPAEVVTAPALAGQVVQLIGGLSNFALGGMGLVVAGAVVAKGPGVLAALSFVALMSLQYLARVGFPRAFAAGLRRELGARAARRARVEVEARPPGVLPPNPGSP